MILEVVALQAENESKETASKRCYEQITRWLSKQNIKTQEQLDSRFDCLMTQFAIEHDDNYIAKDRRLIFNWQN